MSVKAAAPVSVCENLQMLCEQDTGSDVSPGFFLFFFSLLYSLQLKTDLLYKTGQLNENQKSPAEIVKGADAAHNPNKLCNHPNLDLVYINDLLEIDFPC